MKITAELFFLIAVGYVFWLSWQVLYEWGGLGLLFLGLLLNGLTIIIVPIALLFFSSPITTAAELLLYLAIPILYYKFITIICKEPDSYSTSDEADEGIFISPSDTKQENYIEPHIFSQFTDSEKILIRMGEEAYKNADSEEERQHIQNDNKHYIEALKKQYQQKDK